MRTPFLRALLCGALISAQSTSAHPSVTEIESLSARDQTDSQTRAAFIENGLCFSYEKLPADWSTCENWCGYKMDEGAMGCLGGAEDQIGWKYKNENGDRYVPGLCVCAQDGLAIAGEFLKVLFEGLAEFGEFMCNYVLPVIEITIDVGLTVIPGGVGGTAVRGIITVAKTLNKNGYGADAFGSWYEGQCPPPEQSLVEKVWQDWLDVPDELVPPKPCVEGNKNCKRDIADIKLENKWLNSRLLSRRARRNVL
jgi:hypothetical protein